MSKIKLFFYTNEESFRKFHVVVRSLHFGTTISIGEGEVAFSSTKSWDRRNREDLIESATP